jgi:hypothetical protein
MRRYHFFLSVLSIAAVVTLASACGSGYNAPPTNPSPPPPTSGPTSTVGIPGGASLLTTTAYSPNPVTIAVGTTIIWTNNDNTAHTSTANNGAWNGTVAPGGQFSFTFSSAGSFPYHCSLHPGMVGTVVVQ